MEDIPELVGGTAVSGGFVVRYDDVAQDGRVNLHAFPHVLGAVSWPSVMRDPLAVSLRGRGIVPILVRMQVQATDARVSVEPPMQARGQWSVWTARSPDGGVDRILLTMRVDLYGRTGHTYRPVDPDAPEVRVGTILADHVFTRPFAPAGQRRVVDLDGFVPERVGSMHRFEDVAADRVEGLPDAPLVFGLVHTDSNHHVNSLVYPRKFEDAAVADRPDRPLGRWYEIAWRKPFFAGEEGRIRRWTVGGGAIGGAFVDRDGAERCRMVLGGDP